MSATRSRQRSQPSPRTSAGADAAEISLTDHAYAALEEMIVTLKLAPGALVSEYDLVAAIGLGRTPIREALQQLAREGLVKVLPRRGIRVGDCDAGQQLLVLEVRRELERLLSRLGALRATSAQRVQFQRIARGMDEASRAASDLAFMRLDRELNGLLMAAAHNAHASAAMRLINGHSRRFWYQHYKEAADLPLCARLHAEQAEAIAIGDQGKAAAAADRLIDYAEAFTRAAAGR